MSTARYTTGCPLCGSRNWAVISFSEDPATGSKEYECHDCGEVIPRPLDADEYED
jgi:predicted RNA-binding Zn-ribbon protein involved in translation (DUF1610 family)